MIISKKKIQAFDSLEKYRDEYFAMYFDGKIYIF